MEIQSPAFFQGPHGRLAYRKRSGVGPGILWLGGFRSDMLGTKAQHLDEWAQQNGRAFLRFDYSGHGESDGRFEDGSIGEWAADALAVLDGLTEGPQIFVASSMGAWVGALLAKKRPDRIAAIIFIAPAPDFTERLMWPAFSESEREQITKEGMLSRPSDYDDAPEIITKKLIEDGRLQLVLSSQLPIRRPVRILQGMKDEAVPWRYALDFAEHIESDDIEIQLTKKGDHRLSTPDDLERLTKVLAAL